MFSTLCYWFLPCVYRCPYLTLYEWCLIMFHESSFIIAWNLITVSTLKIRCSGLVFKMMMVFLSKLSSNIIISSIQFGSASAVYCSGFMPPSQPCMSLNTSPAKVSFISLPFPLFVFFLMLLLILDPLFDFLES